MASVTFAIDEKLKEDLDHFSWVNWSKIVRDEITKDLNKSTALEKVLKIVAKSKFTEKDANLLSIKVKESMHKKLKEEGLT